MENEDQDTVALLEKCADVDKKVTRLPEAKRYSMESTDGMGRQRYIDEVKKWDDSRRPLVGRWTRRGRNCGDKIKGQGGRQDPR
jgi:hypothetical protein